MSRFMKAGDAVWITAYDEAWPEQFQSLARPLRQALGAVARRIDHIGSTSVAQLVYTEAKSPSIWRVVAQADEWTQREETAQTEPGARYAHR
jgi:GrpB-like predicted nucleotidyltransferase (UPF0157 family)